jgi:hypothetical protein
MHKNHQQKKNRNIQIMTKTVIYIKNSDKSEPKSHQNPSSVIDPNKNNPAKGTELYDLPPANG